MGYAIGMPLLTALGLATSLLVPRLMDPTEFGSYALLLNLFRYASRGDLGLAQLADKRIAAGRGLNEASLGGGAAADAILRARSRLGLFGLVVMAPAAMAIAALTSAMSPIDAALASVAGTAAMVAGGPSTILRAKGDVWAYTALSFLFGIGFIVPRILGIVAAGTTGCFAFLLLWYGAVVLAFHTNRTTRRGSASCTTTIAEALPMFAFVAAWTLYLSANRWMSAVLTDARDLGLFALGANLCATAVTTLAGVGDVRYPTWLKRLSSCPPGDEGLAVAREAAFIALLVAACVACFVPFAARSIALAFPSYVGSAPSFVALAIACVPLSVVAWFVPVAVAHATKPGRACATMFLPAGLTLVAGMAVGQAFGGIEGQGWGFCASALIALIAMAGVMREEGILRTAAAIRFVLVPVTLVAVLMSLDVAYGPRGPSASLASAPSVPPDGYVRTFHDAFETLDLWDGQRGTWEPGFPWGGRTNPTANELEYYVDPRPGRDAPVVQADAPFRSTPNGLIVSARPMPVAVALWPKIKRLSYTSGLITTIRSFIFTYGYVEMRASVPRGKGLWPAFWLLPASRRWPPEIDIMEVIGSEDRKYWATIHDGTASVPKITQGMVETSELYGTFHDYGLLWSKTSIVWYFDGRPVFAAPTPDSLREPMYLLLNLAVGGDWPGVPDETTRFPAEFRIARVSVYQNAAPAKDTSE